MIRAILVACLVACLLGSQVPLAGATAARAAAAVDPSFPTITVSDSRVTVGKTVTVYGEGPGLRRTFLQLRTKENGWQPVASMTTGLDGAYAFTAPDWFGTHRLRVVAPATLLAAAAVSEPRTVAVTMPYRPRGKASEWTWISHRGARWDPCRPITYRVNPRGGYGRATADINWVIRKVARVTGFRFDYLGSTTSKVTRGKHGTHPTGTDLIIDWQRPRQDRGLAGRVAGIGGHWVQDGRRFDGFVVLDQREQMPRKTWRQVMMHEIGHVVGLGHTRSEKQVMSRGTTSSDNRWGAGDLSGMRRLGASRGCLAARSDRGIAALSQRPAATPTPH